MKDLKVRLWIILIVVVGCLFLFLNPFMEHAQGEGWSPNIKLGLDLKGGIYLVLEMDSDQAIKNAVQTDVARLENFIEEKDLKLENVYPSAEALGELVVENPSPEIATAVKDAFDEYLGQSYTLKEEQNRLVATMKESVRTQKRNQAIEDSLSLIANRINVYGVAEPKVQRQGSNSNRIVLELPGVEDSTEIKELITKASNLEWRLIQDPQNGESSRAALEARYPEGLPGNLQILEGDANKSYTQGKFYLVDTYAPVTGADLKEVREAQGEFGTPVVQFFLGPDSAEKFGEFTTNNIGNPLGIIIDGVVVSTPTIQARLTDSGVITGQFTPVEVRTLINNLKSGSLPAVPHVAEERTIGPSLGKDQIKKGVSSAVYGLIAVLIFMLIYYQLAGINASIALIFNLIILMGIMSMFGMVLTVPGIAGIVLTIGMAVDANVLIFERIKEERRLGKSRSSSLDAGFEKAFSAIFDANVTTLIAALFLIQFGSGPVRGFAVTLSVGILASMFTAIFVSRVIFDLVSNIQAKRKTTGKVLMGPLHFMSDLKFNFMGGSVFAVPLSILIVGGASFIFATKGLNYGVDFAGGTDIQVKYNHAPDLESLKKVIGDAISEDPQVIVIGEPGDNEVLIKVPGHLGKNMVEEEESGNSRSADALAAMRGEEHMGWDAEGKLDLNLASSRAMVDAMMKAKENGALEGDKAQYDTFVKSLKSVKEGNGGVLSTFAELNGKPGAAEDLMVWLEANSFLGDFSVRRLESVGPTVGKELRTKATQAIVFSIVGILIYLWFRFQLRFSVGAIVAAVHDVLITLGILSLLDVSFDLNVVAALLTVVGYSLNDSIVVFDRIRENLNRVRRKTEKEVMNISLNETLSRTLMTSGTTMFVVLCLLFLGGDAVHGFALVLMMGVLVGTYSSIFVATPMVLMWDRLSGKASDKRKGNGNKEAAATTTA